MVRQRRRRPGLIALSVALIAAGGLSGAVLYSSSGHRTAVVVVARDVPVGSRIAEADLATASIALDPAVQSVKASRATGLVGQRAATDYVAVPATEGPALAARVATGNVALVVVARDGS